MHMMCIANNKNMVIIVNDKLNKEVYLILKPKITEIRRILFMLLRKKYVPM